MKYGIKMFLKKTVIFIVVAVLLLSAVNLAYVTYVLPQKNLHKTVSQYEEFKQDTSVLVVGDSMARSDIRADLIPGVFNFADDASSYVVVYHKLRKALEVDDLDVDLVIWSVHPRHFSIDQTFFTWYWTDYLDVGVCEMSEVADKNFARLWLESEFPVIGHGNEFGMVFSDRSTDIVKGWKAVDKDFSKEPDLTASAEDIFLRHFSNGYNSFYDRNLLYFEKSLELLDSNDVKVVLVKLPLTPEYIDAFDTFDIPRNGAYDTISESLYGHGEIVVLDYEMIFDDRSFFGDAAHLNPEGADVFTAWLFSDLEEYGLLPKDLKY